MYDIPQHPSLRLLEMRWLMVSRPLAIHLGFLSRRQKLSISTTKTVHRRGDARDSSEALSRIRHIPTTPPAVLPLVFLFSDPKTLVTFKLFRMDFIFATFAPPAPYQQQVQGDSRLFERGCRVAKRVKSS